MKRMKHLFLRAGNCLQIAVFQGSCLFVCERLLTATSHAFTANWLSSTWHMAELVVCTTRSIIYVTILSYIQHNASSQETIVNSVWNSMRYEFWLDIVYIIIKYIGRTKFTWLMLIRRVKLICELVINYDKRYECSFEFGTNRARRCVILLSR